MYIREFTQAKNHMNVTYVESVLTRSQISLHMRKFTQARNPLNVRNVGNHLVSSRISLFIRKLTWGRNLVPEIWGSRLSEDKPPQA